jgi:hypothetical protein
MTEPASAGPDAAVVDAARLLQQLERPDLAERVSAAAARLKRPATVVCVVGEFKQGKSSLVNALLGQHVCPVDDDLATSAITLVRYADEPSAIVRRRVPRVSAVVPPGGGPPPQDPRGGEVVVEHAAIDDLHQWVSEAGNPGNHKAVDRVEIATPSALLRNGLVMVDTPGMGGLGAGHAAATLGFLPFADGLLFVSDASSELTAPEIAFLERAYELCPTVLFALTKIDLYPQWKRIMEIDEGHLARAGLHDIPIVGVSSSLRIEALRRKDRSLNEASRVPELVRHLSSDVVEPAKANAVGRSVGEASAALTQVSAGLRAEAALLADPGQAEAAVRDLERAKERLEFLRGPGARWSVLVNDRVADLSNEVNHHFRGAFRSISKMMDERIETLTKGTEWDELTAYLQRVVADEVTNTFVELETGRSTIRAEVVDLLREEQVDLGQKSALAASLDVGEIWQSKALDPQASTGKKAFGTVVTGARGAQGGIMMFGMMGTFLPAAAGVLLLSNPVLLGIGAVFGGMGLADDRRRKVAARRLAARTQVRQFLDDISFEMGNETGAMVREIQRELRDDFTERIGELIRTYTETAQRAQADMQSGAAERQHRAQNLDAQLTALDGVQRRLATFAAVGP